MTGPLPSVKNVQCLLIEGPDAHRFAQAQFSGDVDRLAPGQWQWNAWLAPQGRVRALMHFVDPGTGVLVAVLRGGDAEGIRAALARYLLRMRATLTLRDYTGFAEGPVEAGSARTDREDIILGYGGRSLRLATATVDSDPAAQTAWRLADIREGWPNLPAGEPAFLPPALRLEHLGAVGFDKGCFPGQEIAARLHYRGGHKYRLVHLHGEAPWPARLPEGTALQALDVVTSNGTTDALVVAPIDIQSALRRLDGAYRVVSEFEA